MHFRAIQLSIAALAERLQGIEARDRNRIERRNQYAFHDHCEGQQGLGGGRHAQ